MSRPLQSAQIELTSDLDRSFDHLYELGVTDGLPVIPPSDERVERFLLAAPFPADEIIATVPPKGSLATVEKIAINAVMAGCRPEYMPVLVAVVQAVCDPGFNLQAIQSTTNPVSPLIVLNGPIRGQIDVNCGRGALGPGRRANATIGRALRLILLNLGGAVPGSVDKSTLGMPGKYTLCLGELEEESPWEPLHVERGFVREDSTVTVIGVQSTQNLSVTWRRASSIFSTMGNGMAAVATNSYKLGAGNPVVILNPGHATLLSHQGFDKHAVKEQLYEHSKIPLEVWPDEITENRIPETHRHVVDGCSTITRSADDIIVIVAGGPEAYHVCYCASFGDTRAITKPIRSIGDDKRDDPAR